MKLLNGKELAGYIRYAYETNLRFFSSRRVPNESERGLLFSLYYKGSLVA
jgi:hypothetical protein